MLNKVPLLFLITITLACKASPHVHTYVPGSNNLEPTKQESTVVKTVAKLFEVHHYKKIAMTDSLSSVIFDRYLKSLDPVKSYLLANDVKDFSQYRSNLGNDLKHGDLSVMFKLFNTFQKRYKERINYSLILLNKKSLLTEGGTYTYDRSKLPWLPSKAAADTLWKHRVIYDLINLQLAGIPEPKKTLALKKRYQNLLKQLNRMDSQDAFQLMMNAFTEAIDPHTTYFSPIRAQEFNEEMARSFEGIGARLLLENEIVTIAEIIPGGPAWKSKMLHVNDKIIAVAQGTNGDFEDVVGWRIDRIVAKIKGPKGSIVRLKIIPATQSLTSKPKVVELMRDKVILEEQSAKKLLKTIDYEGKKFKIGIITVPGFYVDFKAYQAGDSNYKSTTRDVKLLLDTLSRQQVDGILIDLRGNGGGSLLEAIALTGLFIEQGPVVQTRDVYGKVTIEENEELNTTYKGPLAVMVDRFSASASEIFAAAIQDYGRGLIIGTRTYGKGTIQSAIGLSKVISPAEHVLQLGGLKKSASGDPYGQINLTTGKFYRVNGSSTQLRGVMPDIQFPMAFPPNKYGESSDRSALPWDTIASCNYTIVADLKPIKPRLISLHEKRMQSSLEYRYMLKDIEDFKKKDNEISIALNSVTLKKERERQEAIALNRENQRRALKHLPPIRKWQTKLKNEIDFIRDEGLQVMADFIKATTNH